MRVELAVSYEVPRRPWQVSDGPTVEIKESNRGRQQNRFMISSYDVSALFALFQVL